MTDIPRELETAIGRARQTYLDLMRRLYELSPSPEAVPALISCAEEFGADAARKAAADEPDRFAVDLAGKELPQDFSPVLSDLVRTGDELDRLVGVREKMYATDDRGHARAFAVQGRDIALDDAAGMTVEIVEPHSAPDAERVRELELAALPDRSMSKDRTRRRGRSR